MTAETMTRSRRVSPLASATSRFEALPAGVQVRELPLLMQLDLRLDPNGPAGDRRGRGAGRRRCPSRPARR